MSVALDLGTRQLRSLRCDGNRLLARHCRAAYLVLDDLPLSRKMLERADIAYASGDGSLILMGDAAIEFSPVFGVPCLPIFPNGRIPRDDPPARQALAALVDTLLPEPGEPDETCCVTIPGHSASIDDKPGKSKGREFVSQLVALRGYRPVVANPSLSLILATLAADSFTGIGFDFGAGRCCASLAHRGVELAHVSISAAGDWIDMELARRDGEFCWDRAGSRFCNTQPATRFKESRTTSVVTPSNERETFLAELVRELVTYVIRQAADAFAATAEASGAGSLGKIPVVIGGGTAKLPGFQTLFEQVWAECPSPLAAKEFRLATDSPDTVARGCLIRAEIEASSAGDERHAA